MNNLNLERLRQLKCAEEYSVGAGKPEIVPITSRADRIVTVTFLCMLLYF